jgi:hypothetical protein
MTSENATSRGKLGRTEPGARTNARRLGKALRNAPSLPMEAPMDHQPDGDVPSRSPDHHPEHLDHTRTELIELITGELRKSWDTAREAGASPEDLRGLLDERRKAMGKRADDPDG